jgi:hypothetical protein
MHSVLTLLLVAFMAPQSAPNSVAFPGGDALAPPPTFCAEVLPFTAFTIEFGEDEEFVDGLEMGCTEGDASGPLDVEALVDAT